MTYLKFLLIPLTLSIFMMTGFAQAQEKALPKYFVGYSLLGKDSKLHSIDENHPELGARLLASGDGYTGVEHITQKTSDSAIFKLGY